MWSICHPNGERGAQLAGPSAATTSRTKMITLQNFVMQLNVISEKFYPA
jgi:hypothetical protein